MPRVSDPESRLSRRLGTADAVVIGLGSMIGTGVFVVWQPAAEAAGRWLLAGLAIAAFVAFCNATSTAQLAAVYPRAGGAYHYGREVLGAGWGALAGYAFVVGKVASSATAALAVGVYLWPQYDRAVAVAAVVVVTAVNIAGVQKTARATWVLVAVVIAVLATVVITGAAGTADGTPGGPTGDIGIDGVLGSAAVMFYAFAGYARVTVLGEEVRDPARAIPRAVVISLALVLVLYAAVGWTVLDVLGPTGAAGSARPLESVAEASGTDWLLPVVGIAAGVAALGALLSLLAGVGRTSFAMAAEGDLPRTLAAVHATRRVPHRAEAAAGLATVGAVLVGDLVATLAVSAFAVLVYYAVANLSALRLAENQRRWPRWLAAAGLVSCLVLASALPWRMILTGASTITVAMLVRAVVRGAIRR